MGVDFGTPCAFKPRDEILERFDPFAMRDEHRVRRLHDDGVAQAHARNQPILRDDEAAFRIDRVNIAVQHVAAAVFRADIPDRAPCADIGPAGLERNDDRLRRLPRRRAH